MAWLYAYAHCEGSMDHVYGAMDCADPVSAQRTSAHPVSASGEMTWKGRGLERAVARDRYSMLCGRIPILPLAQPQPTNEGENGLQA